VSHAAAAAGSEEEFFTLLRKSGVQVRARPSTRNPGEVTGYAVALDGEVTKSGSPAPPPGTRPSVRSTWPPPTSAR
jgi:hypothetical protein